MEKMGALELPASRVPGARATAVRLSILVCSRSDSTASDGQPEAKLAQAAEATPKIPYAIPLPASGGGDVAVRAFANSAAYVRRESSIRFLAVDRREQRLDRHRLLDQRLVGEILHKRLERRPVGLDPVRPRVAAEHLVDLLQLRRHPRQHVAQRAELAHLLRGDRLGL